MNLLVVKAVVPTSIGGSDAMVDQYGDTPELLFWMGIFLGVMGLGLIAFAVALVARSYT